MTDQAARQTVFATLRCRDAGAMTEFLTKAFGFTEVVAYRDDSGAIAHAQLAYGPASLMLGQAGDSDFDRLVEGFGPSALYVVVDDPHAHCATARRSSRSRTSRSTAHWTTWPATPRATCGPSAPTPARRVRLFGTYGGAQA